MKNNKIWFATGNPDKVKEASSVLLNYGIEVSHHPIKRIEIQANRLEEIAKYSLQVIETDKPTVVEDSGLFIEEFKGFPGPYSHYILDTIGLLGILKLMKGVNKRNASFQSVIAYRQNSDIHVFKGIVKGRISNDIKGSHGFGFDPIFIPDNIQTDETFGELPIKIKNRLSHRGRSFKALGEWIKRTSNLF